MPKNRMSDNVSQVIRPFRMYIKTIDCQVISRIFMTILSYRLDVFKEQVLSQHNAVK